MHGEPADERCHVHGMSLESAIDSDVVERHACARCRAQQLSVVHIMCRHAMISRRIQGANPCAEHGRNTVTRLDPTSCLIQDAKDIDGLGNGGLVDRAYALMHDSPYQDPAWETDPFWLESYPAATATGGD